MDTRWIDDLPGQSVGLGRSRVVWRGLGERVGSQMTAAEAACPAVLARAGSGVRDARPEGSDHRRGSVLAQVALEGLPDLRLEIACLR